MVFGNEMVLLVNYSLSLLSKVELITSWQIWEEIKCMVLYVSLPNRTKNSLIQFNKADNRYYVRAYCPKIYTLSLGEKKIY
mgnify:CR=1 FL=1